MILLNEIFQTLATPYDHVLFALLKFVLLCADLFENHPLSFTLGSRIRRICLTLPGIGRVVRC